MACGPFSASWDLICDVAESVLKSGKIGLFLVEPHAPGVNSAQIIRALKFSHQQHHNQSLTLIQLLRSTRKYKATDLRDKVFALQGVMTDTSSFCNTVNYGSTMEEVYLAFAVYNLQDRKDLVWLSNADLAHIHRIAIFHHGCQTGVTTIIGKEFSLPPINFGQAETLSHHYRSHRTTRC